MLFNKKNKKGDAITRYGFVSNTESYIYDLLLNPIQARTSDYLKSYGITGEKLLPILLKKGSDGDSILSRKEKIKTDKNTKRDRFSVVYRLNDKTNVERKLRDLYINLFEYYIPSNNFLIEDGEGCSASSASCDGFCNGANTSSQSGQYSAPLNHKNIKRTFYLTTEQIKSIRESTSCGNSSGQYTSTAFLDNKSLNHNNIIQK